MSGDSAIPQRTPCQQALWRRLLEHMRRNIFYIYTFCQSSQYILQRGQKLGHEELCSDRDYKDVCRNSDCRSLTDVPFCKYSSTVSCLLDYYWMALNELLWISSFVNIA